MATGIAVSGVSAMVGAAAPAYAATSVEGNCLASVIPLATPSDDGTNTSITVTWTDQCTNVNSYDVERSADHGATFTIIASNLAPNTLPPPTGGPTQTQSYVDSNLPCGQYIYRAIAVHNPGNATPKTSISPDSNEVTVSLSQDCSGGSTTGACDLLTGALTLGYYSNKNGQATLVDGDFTTLTSLNLVSANGGTRDFVGTLSQNKTALKNWLLNATATNMSYMLSAQLATLELNVIHGVVDPSMKLCEVGDTTIGAIADEANDFLGAHPIVLGGDVNRVDGDALQTLINEINNDLVLVH